MEIDWSLVARNIDGVPVLVRRVIQFLVILALFGIVYGLLKAWLERRREAAGWSDAQLQTRAAALRATAMIIGLIVAAASVGLLSDRPLWDFLGTVAGAVLGVVRAILWAAALIVGALVLGLVLGAREEALSLVGGLLLMAKRGKTRDLPGVGDRVQIGDAQGTIEGFSLFKTRLRRDDGDVVFLPNAWAVDARARVLGSRAAPQPTPPGTASSPQAE
jgi:small-conductance mechanosensitive channel